MPLYQPIDYTQGRQQPQLDTMGLMGMLQRAQQQEQEQEQQQQFQQSIGSMIDDGNIDFQRLMAQFPDQQDFLIKMENQQNLRNQMRDTNAGRDAVNLYRAIDRGDMAGAQALIEQNANEINSFGDPSFTAQTAMEMLQNNPEGLKNSALNIARIAGGQDDFLSAIESGQPEPMTEYQQAMISQKEVDQELRRLEIENKNLENRQKQAKSDLEKQRLQQQIDANKVNTEQAQQAKQVKQQEAITSTQQTLESVNELLNAPGFEAAVGTTGAFPTLPGSEAADFETALDSFIGNLTLENMGKMSGVLSDSDIKMIKSASSGLSVKMSEGAFKKRLQKIKDRLEEKLAAQGGEVSQPPAATADGNFSSLWGD
ncbi:hypothetical protein AB832_08190 [Flavobacteriaceae bacterium (ex Bugula neritina AB1)]|jgi:hypothetical protein|nr:hypothetical protein AB832_08190 [Flavobacteriaceae bacterium (ex Bugula neritina AB1)]